MDHFITRGHRYLYTASAGFLIGGIWAGSLQMFLTGLVVGAFAAILHTSRDW